MRSGLTRADTRKQRIAILQVNCDASKCELGTEIWCREKELEGRWRDKYLKRRRVQSPTLPQLQ